MTRAHKTGFVIPSQNEWIKAAYYDPSGGGTYSYWKYPTNPGVFGDGTRDRPAARPRSTRPPATSPTPRPSRWRPTTPPKPPAPSWCPAAFSRRSLLDASTPSGSTPPPTQRPTRAASARSARRKTTSPWGTLDQGGNAVEWTDTITAAAVRRSSDGRVWRRLHGGIANAPAYQLWLSAVGLQPQDNAVFTATYPWLGFRIGVLGNLEGRPAA